MQGVQGMHPQTTLYNSLLQQSVSVRYRRDSISDSKQPSTVITTLQQARKQPAIRSLATLQETHMTMSVSNKPSCVLAPCFLLFLLLLSVTMVMGESGAALEENEGDGLRVKRGTIVKDGFDQLEKDEIVSHHNTLRDDVIPSASPSLPVLSWETSLQEKAKTHAQKCVYTHSGGDDGENIYASSVFYGESSRVTQILDKWYSETESYDITKDVGQECTVDKVCGHYTQMVWAETTLVGCWVKDCQPLYKIDGTKQYDQSFLVVCNYKTAGNVIGEKPYNPA